MAARKVSGMVDVSAKRITRRVARASGRVILSPSITKAFMQQGSPKGDLVTTARIAGILAAKETPQAIPLCHTISLEKVHVQITFDDASCCFHIEAEVLALAKTGVEMEALSACAASALTIYDMLKCFGHQITISDLKLCYKSGGQGGVVRL